MARFTSSAFRGNNSYRTNNGISYGGKFAERNDRRPMTTLEAKRKEIEILENKLKAAQKEQQLTCPNMHKIINEFGDEVLNVEDTGRTDYKNRPIYKCRTCHAEGVLGVIDDEEFNIAKQVVTSMLFQINATSSGQEDARLKDMKKAFAIFLDLLPQYYEPVKNSTNNNNHNNDNKTSDIGNTNNNYSPVDNTSMPYENNGSGGHEDYYDQGYGDNYAAYNTGNYGYNNYGGGYGNQDMNYGAPGYQGGGYYQSGYDDGSGDFRQHMGGYGMTEF